MSKKTMMKKKEDILDLSVKTVTAYLQGLGPETWQGQAPTLSYLESGDLARVSRSSSAGPSLRVEDIRGHKGLSDSSLESLFIFFIFFYSINIKLTLIKPSLPKGPATTAEQLSPLGTQVFHRAKTTAVFGRTANQSQRSR